jgi:hypothetical protein
MGAFAAGKRSGNNLPLYFLNTPLTPPKRRELSPKLIKHLSEATALGSVA